MNNILTVYKLNFPFGEKSSYDKAKYESIAHEIKWFLQYEEIYLSSEKKVFTEFETLEMLFNWGKIKLLFYYEKQHLFLPSFQVDLFADGFLDTNFFYKFYPIFSDIDANDYIFDLITDKLKIPNSTIITDKYLAQQFLTFNLKKLQKCVDSIERWYLTEQLERNPEMRNHLYYLIFLNYKLFKNILLSSGWIIQLENLLWEDIDDNLKWELSLTKERVDHVSNTNITVFAKYKHMLEELISLLDS